MSTGHVQKSIGYYRKLFILYIPFIQLKKKTSIKTEIVSCLLKG